MKKIIVIALCLLFMSCYQMVFVHDLSELDSYGISKKDIKKVEQVDNRSSSKLYRVYYRK